MEAKHLHELRRERPVHHAAMRLAPRRIDNVREELDKMLRTRVVISSASACSFTLAKVSEKDGKPRFCVDYRAPSQRNKANHLLLPKSNEIFHDFKGSKKLCTPDLVYRLLGKKNGRAPQGNNLSHLQIRDAQT